MMVVGNCHHHVVLLGPTIPTSSCHPSSTPASPWGLSNLEIHSEEVTKNAKTRYSMVFPWSSRISQNLRSRPIRRSASLPTISVDGLRPKLGYSFELEMTTVPVLSTNSLARPLLATSPPGQDRAIDGTDLFGPSRERSIKPKSLSLFFIWTAVNSISDGGCPVTRVQLNRRDIF